MHVCSAFAGRLHTQDFELLGDVIDRHFVAFGAGLAAFEAVIGQVGDVGFDGGGLHLLQGLRHGLSNHQRRLCLDRAVTQQPGEDA